MNKIILKEKLLHQLEYANDFGNNECICKLGLFPLLRCVKTFDMLFWGKPRNA
jgi:hypothetical protein